MSSSVPLAALVVLGVLALFSCSEPEPPATALPAATALPVPTSTITPFPTLTPTPIPTLEPMLPIRVHQYTHYLTGSGPGDRIRVFDERTHARTYGIHPGCDWVLNRMKHYDSQPDKWSRLANDLRRTWYNAPLNPTRRISQITGEYCKHGGPTNPEKSDSALNRTVRQLLEELGPAPTPGTIVYLGGDTTPPIKYNLPENIR